jgi:biopolymer transport protein ExbB/TolQ
METLTISPVEYFQQAGPVGKTVILILLLASIWCWALIIEGAVNVWRFGLALKSWHERKDTPLLDAILVAGHEGHVRAKGLDAGETRHRTVEAMNRCAKKIIARLDGGLANLAVISSVAPFVGLFGTVWGIMASFSAIAQAKDTSLAVVAPGIAEALATTAIGLAAAIPAAIGYNRLGSAMTARADELAGLIEERALDLVAPHPESKLREVA